MSEQEINTGGAAFPHKAKYWDENCDGYRDSVDRYECGITIRDYFAAKALQGLLACQSLGYLYTGKDAELKAASEAYRYANAMIAAREEKP